MSARHVGPLALIYKMVSPVADLYFLGFCTASFISFEIALDKPFWSRHKARSVPLRRREGSSHKARAGSRLYRRLKPSERLAGLAQLVEQLFCKHQVTGSNPVAGTIPNIPSADYPSPDWLP